MLKSSKNGFVPQASTKNLGTALGGSGGSGGGSYTVATVPDPAERVGQTIYVTDGALGAPCAAFSNGVNWLRFTLGTPIAASVFFDDFNGSTLDPAWNWLNQGDATATVATGDCSITSDNNSGAAQPIRGLYRAFDGSVDFTLTAYLTRDTVNDASNRFTLAGIFVRDSSLGQINMLSVGWGDGYREIVWRHDGDGATYSNYEGYNATNYSSAYLRIVKSGSTITFSASADNSTWVDTYVGDVSDWTPDIDSIGFGVINSNASTGGSPATQVFHYVGAE